MTKFSFLIHKLQYKWLFDIIFAEHADNMRCAQYFNIISTPGIVAERYRWMVA